MASSLINAAGSFAQAVVASQHMLPAITAAATPLPTPTSKTFYSFHTQITHPTVNELGHLIVWTNGCEENAEDEVEYGLANFGDNFGVKFLKSFSMKEGSESSEETMMVFVQTIDKGRFGSFKAFDQLETCQKIVFSLPSFIKLAKFFQGKLWAEKQQEKCRGKVIFTETLDILGEKVVLKIGAKFIKDTTDVFVFYECVETNLWVEDLGLLKLDERGINLLVANLSHSQNCAHSPLPFSFKLPIHASVAGIWQPPAATLPPPLLPPLPPPPQQPEQQQQQQQQQQQPLENGATVQYSIELIPPSSLDEDDSLFAFLADFPIPVSTSSSPPTMIGVIDQPVCLIEGEQQSFTPIIPSPTVTTPTTTTTTFTTSSFSFPLNNITNHQQFQQFQQPQQPTAAPVFKNLTNIQNVPPPPPPKRAYKRKQPLTKFQIWRQNQSLNNGLGQNSKNILNCSVAVSSSPKKNKLHI